MAMPAVPGVGLAMVEPEIVLGALETFLNGPTQASGTGEFGKRRAGGCEDEVVRPLIGGLAIASDQKPTLGLWRMDPGQRNSCPVVEPQSFRPSPAACVVHLFGASASAISAGLVCSR